MITVHMIGNAHLDPVWLWEREDGVDAVLATARSACDRLDEYPEFVFTCAATWFYEQVETIDPRLFDRIRRHVVNGRWQLAGGMIVQPDCNVPNAESFRWQLAEGQAYYRERFGRTTRVGYNVDSFGHTAYLPRFLREAGIDSYVFMRPGKHEKSLPSRVFRWRSPDGNEVTAYRIANCYNVWQDQLAENIRTSLTDLPEGIEHTMCFYGVGDHGGGPTRANIEWVLVNTETIDGVRLVFSHPRAFFDAIASQQEALPAVSDELQYHAIGCYSVQRDLHLAVRRAEARLGQADETLRRFPDRSSEAERRMLVPARHRLLFNEFHDILGGTSLWSASGRALGELLASESDAREAITRVTRRATRAEARPGKHRVALYNPSTAGCTGLISYEPFLDWQGHDYHLLNEQGRNIPHQWVHGGSITPVRRLIFPAELGPGQLRFFRLEGLGRPADAPPAVGFTVDDEHVSEGQLEVRVAGAAIVLNGWRLRLETCEDLSDTWSHGTDHFEGPVLGRVEWADRQVIERGPLRAGLRLGGALGHSRFWCRLMLARDGALQVRLRVTWVEGRQRLRLRLESPAELRERTDLVSGGPLRRGFGLQEYPLNGGLLVGAGDARLGIVAPDVFSVSAESKAVNLTLLRSPYVSHHQPNLPEEGAPGTEPDRRDQWLTDQGNHEFELRLIPDPEVEIDRVVAEAHQMLAPPIIWDLTG